MFSILGFTFAVAAVLFIHVAAWRRQARRQEARQRHHLRLAQSWRASTNLHG